MKVQVVGGVNLDTTLRSIDQPVPGSSSPAIRSVGWGGVGRNIAANLAHLGENVVLVGRVGAEPEADALLAELQRLGIDTRSITIDPAVATGTYTAVLDPDGSLLFGLADMRACDAIRPADVPDLDGYDWLVLDGNLRSQTLRNLLTRAHAAGVPVALDPCGVTKAGRLGSLTALPVHTLTPNLDELRALGGSQDPDEAVARVLARGVEVLWVRHGPAGSWLHRRDEEPVYVASPEVTPVDVTGAGDAMLAAYLHRLGRGDSLAAAAAVGASAAAMTVGVSGTVHPDLTPALLAHTHEGHPHEERP